MPDQPAYCTIVAELARTILTASVVSPEALAFVSACIGKADAIEVNAGIESARMLDEVLRVGGISMAIALADNVSGPRGNRSSIAE
jgi:hypothetical protein